MKRLEATQPGTNGSECTYTQQRFLDRTPKSFTASFLELMVLASHSRSLPVLFECLPIFRARCANESVPCFGDLQQVCKLDYLQPSSQRL